MTINLIAIEEAIRDHMGNQPYSICCAECGKDLEKDTEVDNDLDINIKVYPCKCQK